MVKVKSQQQGLELSSNSSAQKSPNDDCPHNHHSQHGSGHNNLPENGPQENGPLDLTGNDIPNDDPKKSLLDHQQHAPQGLNWRKFIYYSLCLPERETERQCKCRCKESLLNILHRIFNIVHYNIYIIQCLFF